MAYADLTFGDPNPIKRWLQRQRLRSAVRLIESRGGVVSFCDFGGGNGELCKLLLQRFPRAAITCYEPAAAMREEARVTLGGVNGVRLCGSLEELAANSFDVVTCLEVFEHLADAEANSALTAIKRLLKPGGVLIVGVPVEVGLPALYKGLFRMSRRYGAFDASPGNILRAVIGRPPAPRPVGEIGPGMPYHFDHLGFDHRRFRDKAVRDFRLEQCVTSPIGWAGAWLMPEIYYLLEK